MEKKVQSVRSLSAFVFRAGTWPVRVLCYVMDLPIRLLPRWCIQLQSTNGLAKRRGCPCTEVNDKGI